MVIILLFIPARLPLQAWVLPWAWVLLPWVLPWAWVLLPWARVLPWTWAGGVFRRGALDFALGGAALGALTLLGRKGKSISYAGSVGRSGIIFLLFDRNLWCLFCGWLLGVYLDLGNPRRFCWQCWRHWLCRCLACDKSSLVSLPLWKVLKCGVKCLTCHFALFSLFSFLQLLYSSVLWLFGKT